MIHPVDVALRSAPVHKFLEYDAGVRHNSTCRILNRPFQDRTGNGLGHADRADCQNHQQTGTQLLNKQSVRKRFNRPLPPD